MGRAKKGLAGRPELGGTGDLFIHVLAHIQHHTPLVCLFENVPSFGTSLAGETLKANLRQIGYDVSEMTTSPNEEWNEPSDRKRWVCVATLIPGFAIQSPMKPFAGKASDYLDAADPVQDKLDAERIATTITGLRAHNARHQAMGHGFGFTTLNGSETKIPTIVKSYHKINVGPFVETAFGPRMLRKHEIEKIQGCEVSTTHYATAVQILGQGVQTRVFSQIVDQLAAFLINPKGVVASAPIPVEFGQLSLFAA
jgi:site-specific DNA-cytosine methylase